jgi:hypothetical protein
MSRTTPTNQNKPEQAPQAKHPVDQPGSRQLRVWLIMLVGALMSAAVVARIPDEVFYSGDGGLKALLAKQFAAGRRACDLQLPADDWLSDLWKQGAYPFAPPFVYQLGGREYLAFPISFPLVTAPFYALLGYRGLYVVPLIALWITWLISFRLCRRLDMGETETTMSMAALVLASPLPLYGAMYWEHTLAVALAWAGIAATLYITDAGRSVRGHLLGGALLGLSVWFRPECICLAGAVLAAYFVLCRKHSRLSLWTAFAAGVLVMAAGFGAANFAIYGNWLGAHSLQVIENLKPAAHISKALALFFGLNAALLLYVPVVLFVLIVLAWPRFSEAVKPTPIITYLLLALLLACCCIPLIVPHTGGRSWGPRFLLCCVPPACLVGGLLLDRINRYASRGTRRAGLALFLAAVLGGLIFNSGVGTTKLLDNYAHRVAPALDFLRNGEHDVIMVTHQYVPQELQALLRNKYFLRLDEKTDLEALASAVRQQGYDRFYLVSARYDNSPAPQRLAVEGRRLRIDGTLLGKYGRSFHVYDCSIHDRE